MTTTEQNQNSEAKTGCAEPVGTGQHPDAAAAVTWNLLILAAMKVLFQLRPGSHRGNTRKGDSVLCPR
jgi:hypothetical protein